MKLAINVNLVDMWTWSQTDGTENNFVNSRDEFNFLNAPCQLGERDSVAGWDTVL
jgi:hypothetical protein